MKMRMFILMMVLFSNSVVLNSCTKTIADPQDDLIDLDAEKSAIINVPFKVEGSITEQDAEALFLCGKKKKWQKRFMLTSLININSGFLGILQKVKPYISKQ